MNVTKLGLSFTSSVLAIALSVAPVHSAIAAPAEDDTGEGDAAEDGDDAPAEGEDAAEDGEGEPAEGDPAEGEGDPAADDATGEGDPAAEGEGDPAEVDPAAEGEGDPAAEDGVDPAAEDEVDPDAEVEVGEGEDELALVDEGPLRPPEPAWGPKKQYPMNGKGALITGGVVAGLGVVGIITSILVTRCNFEGALTCRYSDQREFLIPLTVTVTGLGLMLVGVGIGNKIKYKKWENWEPENTAVVPTMMRGGGGLAWVGRF